MFRFIFVYEIICFADLVRSFYQNIKTYSALASQPHSIYRHQYHIHSIIIQTSVMEYLLELKHYFIQQ